MRKTSINQDLIHTLDDSISIFSVFREDSLTDEILCLKKGQSLGTKSCSSVRAGSSELSVVMVIRDERSIITLLVEAVKSSSSKRMSHRIDKTFGTWIENQQILFIFHTQMKKYYIRTIRGAFKLNFLFSFPNLSIDRREKTNLIGQKSMH